MEWAIFIGLMVIFIAAVRPLRARIAASGSPGAQRFRQLHKPMEWIGAVVLVVGALGVLFLPEAGVPAVVPVLGAIIFYCSLLTRPPTVGLDGTGGPGH